MSDTTKDDVSCPECRGSGGFIWGGDHWEECKECGGSGEKDEEEMLRGRME